MSNIDSFFKGVEFRENQKTLERFEKCKSQTEEDRVADFMRESFDEFAKGRTVETSRGERPLTIARIDKYFKPETLKSADVFLRCKATLEAFRPTGMEKTYVSLLSYLAPTHYQVVEETAGVYKFSYDKEEFRKNFGTLAFDSTLSRWKSNIDNWLAKGWISEEGHKELVNECNQFIIETLPRVNTPRGTPKSKHLEREKSRSPSPAAARTPTRPRGDSPINFSPRHPQGVKRPSPLSHSTVVSASVSDS